MSSPVDALPHRTLSSSRPSPSASHQPQPAPPHACARKTTLRRRLCAEPPSSISVSPPSQSSRSGVCTLPFPSTFVRLAFRPASCSRARARPLRGRAPARRVPVRCIPRRASAATAHSRPRLVHPPGRRWHIMVSLPPARGAQGSSLSPRPVRPAQAAAAVACIGPPAGGPAGGHLGPGCLVWNGDEARAWARLRISDRVRGRSASGRSTSAGERHVMILSVVSRTADAL